MRCLLAVVLAALGSLATAGATTSDDPAEAVPYRVTEITIRNEPAGVTLAGTLTLPRAEGPTPAVLLVPGISPVDRDQSLFGHKPFRLLADHLTRNGIAVLRIDDRGVGGSSGDKSQATMEDLADDILLGVRYLRAHEAIDAARVGLLGHSAGAIAASVAAARPPGVAFLVLLAGTARPYSDLVVLPWTEDGEETRALVAEHVDALVEVLAEGPPAVEAERRVREKWAAIAAGLTPDQKRAIGPFTIAWDRQLPVFLQPLFRDLLLLDPARPLVRSDCPVLAIVGGREQGASRAADNYPAMLDALERGTDDYALMKLRGLNHLLQRCETCTMQEVAGIKETMAPSALAAITGWIRERMVRAGAP